MASSEVMTSELNRLNLATAGILKPRQGAGQETADAPSP